MTTAQAPAKTNGNGDHQQPKRDLSIREILKSDDFIAELGKAMPAHCKPERMARVALTAMTRTPKLAECDKPSFFRCLLDLSQWGLEPDGRRAHLIPFENRKRGVVECQLIIDYKGLVELAYRSGVTKNIHADVVREGDIFEYSKGKLGKHVPHFLRADSNKPKDAGRVYAVYCEIELEGGTTKVEVLSLDEVETVRKRSRAGNNGPWVSDWNEMAKKTAFRRASKWVPLSAEIHDAIATDDDAIDVESAPQRTLPTAPARSLGQLTELLSHDPDAGEEGGEIIDEQQDGGPVLDATDSQDDDPMLSPENDPTGLLGTVTMQLNAASMQKDVDRIEAMIRNPETEAPQAIKDEALRRCQVKRDSLRGKK